MKNVIVFCYFLAFLPSCKESLNTFQGSISLNPPHHLTVEYIRNTTDVLIVDINPEFAWELPKGIIQQSAYQVLVSSNKELIDSDKGDIWDTGKIENDESIDITFKGNSLQVGNTYFWKVKVWDEKQRETPFSTFQSFTMGNQGKLLTSANSFQVDKIKPVDYQKLQNESHLIDFGKDAFANMEFNYNAEENGTLVVHIGEQLVDGRINREPAGTIRYQKVMVPVKPEKKRYILPIKPDKRNTKPGAIILPDSFPVLMPFRYAEIENYKGDFNSDEFTQLAYHSYWEDNTSFFTSSDSTLNKVWDLCKYSIKQTSFAGVYVDGDRERIPYEADAYLNQLSHYTTDKEFAMARLTIEYFMEHPTWPTEWQLHVALMFYADYMYTGNTELIEKYYDKLKYKTLIELRRDDGLISSANATPEFMKKLGFKDPTIKLKDIVDWPPAQKDTGWKLATAEGERDGFVFTPINTVVNCMYFRNIEIMAEFAQILSKPEEAAKYKKLASQVKASINEKLLDTKRGYYRDGEDTDHASLHSNMMALAFNIVPATNVQSVADFIKSRGMACSVYGSQYLMEALYNANESEYALSLLNSTASRSWYNMIRIGSTVTLEAWDMKYKPNSDWNHAWGAAPANIIPSYLWGIRPKTPGFATITIKPQLSKLKTSAISIPTIRGSIKANYTVQKDGTKNYIIDIPPNVNAEFEASASSNITVNSKTQTSGTKTVYLNAGTNNIEITNN